jgi:hypothetical protein
MSCLDKQTGCSIGKSKSLPYLRQAEQFTIESKIANLAQAAVNVKFQKLIYK